MNVDAESKEVIIKRLHEFRWPFGVITYYVLQKSDESLFLSEVKTYVEQSQGSLQKLFDNQNSKCIKEKFLNKV